MSQVDPGAVPVTIVGGYLGAGKTTLLNRLLAGDHGRRLAVLVNDFGAVNIDAELIATHDGDTVTLENGCICCSIADALGDALDRVLASDPPPDQIVVEASGAADPAKVAHYGRGWPGCRLDAVVVLADTDTIRRQARDEFVGELVVRQLQAADIAVLTKTDLVSADTFDDVRAWLEERTARTTGRPTVLGAAHGRLDPALLLDPDIDRRHQRSDPSSTTGQHDAARADPSAPAERDAADLFATHTIELPDSIAHARLAAALDAWPEEIVRVKGIVEIEGSGPAVVQRVGRRWSIEPWPVDRSAPAHRSLVLIGLADVVDPSDQSEPAGWSSWSRWLVIDSEPMA